MGKQSTRSQCRPPYLCYARSFSLLQPKRMTTALLLLCRTMQAQLYWGRASGYARPLSLSLQTFTPGVTSDKHALQTHILC